MRHQEKNKILEEFVSVHAFVVNRSGAASEFRRAHVCGCLVPGVFDQCVHSPHLCVCVCLRQGQHMYSIPPGGFRHPYPALAMNASMSR